MMPLTAARRKLLGDAAANAAQLALSATAQFIQFAGPADRLCESDLRASGESGSGADGHLQAAGRSFAVIV
jgi:hypothetical protein